MAGTPSPAEIADLPYRPCVGLMVLNRDCHIFAGQRIDSSHDAWQMPQGGIDPGETPTEAALRELGEETGIRSDRVTILRESAHWRDYDLPPHLVQKLWKGRYRGQTQRWFAISFLGDDAEIDITVHEQEFSRWSWMAPDELMLRIVPFKRDTYGAVFAEFADLIDRGR
ncbi:MAG: RNA pyrophosphohydrolase [Pseudomonadota bacterium]